MKIDKILVAIDRSHISERNRSVFDSAMSLAQKTNATLLLLHVVSEGEAGYPLLQTYDYYSMLAEKDLELYHKQVEEYKQLGFNLLESLARKARSEGIKTEYTQLTGNPGRKICELASNWSADLILVGSRGLHGLKEMFLGSVSNYVTHHAPCSVLIVRSSIDSPSTSDSPSSEENTVSIN